MSFKKNQKAYNKEVMATGRAANRYLSNALGLINQYTTNYADRTDFWTNPVVLNSALEIAKPLIDSVIL